MIKKKGKNIKYIIHHITMWDNTLMNNKYDMTASWLQSDFKMDFCETMTTIANFCKTTTIVLLDQGISVVDFQFKLQTFTPPMPMCKHECYSSMCRFLRNIIYKASKHDPSVVLQQIYRIYWFKIAFDKKTKGSFKFVFKHICFGFQISWIGTMKTSYSVRCINIPIWLKPHIQYHYVANQRRTFES